MPQSLFKFDKATDTIKYLDVPNAYRMAGVQSLSKEINFDGTVATAIDKIEFLFINTIDRRCQVPSATL